MKRACALALASLLVLATAVPAAEAPQVGDQAPPFEMVGSDGKTYKLSDLRGKTVVIAWYPKAFTGG
jgi:thioredoxin-dependent peroxiredoxin